MATGRMHTWGAPGLRTPGDRGYMMQGGVMGMEVFRQAPGARGRYGTADVTSGVVLDPPRTFDVWALAKQAALGGILGAVLPGVGVRAGATMGLAYGALHEVLALGTDFPRTPLAGPCDCLGETR